MNNEFSSLAYGTWSGIWGRKSAQNISLIEIKQSLLLLEIAFSNGINVFDTATMYGEGNSERIIGEFIKKVKREKIYLSTKVKGSDLSYNSVIRSAEESLCRMNVEYIDMLYVHWYNNKIPIRETFDAFLFLQDKKKVNKICISNFNLEQLIEAHTILGAKLFSIQLEYNYIKRNNGKIIYVENEILPYCKSNNIVFFAYNPLDSVISCNDDRKTKLENIALKYNKTIPQVAINWLLSKNIHVIIGTSTIEHLLENIRSGFIIDENDIQYLNNEL